MVEKESSRFVQLGSEAGVRQLVDAFYDVMDREPRFAQLRGMHPPDLAESRDKLFAFLCGYTGGPDLYFQQYGYKNLKNAHRPFFIGAEDATAWLDCMNAAMNELGIEGQLRSRLARAFRGTASAMINQG